MVFSWGKVQRTKAASMAGEMHGKTVVITGGTGNVGRAVASRFAKAGANLILVDRDMQRLQDFAAELHSTYAVQTHPAQVDALDAAAVETFIEAAVERFGQIDIVAHTIGGFAYGDPVYAMNMDTLQQQINLNVLPIYTFVGRVVKHMLDQGVRGKVVIVLSRAAVKGGANSSAYTATKAAAQSVMESLALEVRDQGIHVNGVMPSIIDTPINRRDMPNADYAKWVTADDIADAMYFLSSDAARSLYGVSLEVYGRV
ncbi:MAG: SDR family NAD(P)-dependent oxidoreductase [bacterium]|nr:SDR family NAD(P)-dependent oxidoreductase [bacterium]